MEARSFYASVRWSICVALLSALAASCSSGGLLPPEKLTDPITPVQGFDMGDKRWLSWNILFKPGADAQARNDAFEYIANYISSHRQLSTNQTKVQVYYCPCDTLLYNIAADVLDGSGQGVTVPPPPPPPPGGSGDRLQYVSPNYVIGDSMPLLNTKTNVRMAMKNFPVRSDKIIAILDTGLDTAYFQQPKIGGLIWNEQNRLANFTSTEDLGNFRDDHKSKHGSAVTAIILNTAKNYQAYPMLMILKVLNKDSRGSTFGVSCALSYAVQKNATLINASLGYYRMKGERVDSVFRHYVGLCNSNSIPVFAAAGNMPGEHDDKNFCLPATSSMQLTDSRLFYPACFTEFTNVISVTGIGPGTPLQQGLAPCYYQNWSGQYVKLGVYNTDSCCKYIVPFVEGAYEGTSFATPAASGMVIGLMMNNNQFQAAMAVISKRDQNLANKTRKGTYCTYSVSPPDSIYTPPNTH